VRRRHLPEGTTPGPSSPWRPVHPGFPGDFRSLVTPSLVVCSSPRRPARTGGLWFPRYPWIRVSFHYVPGKPHGEVPVERALFRAPPHRTTQAPQCTWLSSDRRRVGGRLFAMDPAVAGVTDHEGLSPFLRPECRPMRTGHCAVRGSRESVRGHEKVLACRHFEVLAHGQREVLARGQRKVLTSR